MDFSLIITSDGSHSLHSAQLNESYHSVHGAVSESIHIFIEAGLNKILETKNEINILEVGFGTGLNAFLTRFFGEEKNAKISYQGIEAFPVKENIYTQLNYPQILNKTDNQYFLDLHLSPWNEWIEISTNFRLLKHLSPISEAILPESFFDLVYFDAFAPQFQPEMWTKEVFEKLWMSMKEDAILTTYCCKGEVKRTLQSVGFSIEKLPGPKGKREMLRARKEPRLDI